MQNPSREILDRIAGEHSAWLGQTGSGKTYGAKASMIEPALKAGRRVVILDPTSVWWGLRLGRDGKGQGFPVTIFGGRHGDFPLEGTSGAALGELVSRDNVPAVMDMRHLSVGDRTRWFTDFADAVLRSNTGPLTIVLDEAHRFAPQARTLSPQGAMMLHQAESLASGGRAIGIRLVLITQRPAKLHKDVLTSCSSLAAFRVVAPQDRDAIKEWVDGCGDPAKGREVIGSLAGLQDGECWLWCPKADYLERVKMPRIATFDSSATPKEDEQIPPPSTLSEKQITALREKLGAAAVEAEANDPKALRGRIRQLERELQAKPAAAPGGSEDVFTVGAVSRMVHDAVEAERKSVRSVALAAVRFIGTSVRGLKTELDRVVKASESLDSLGREVSALCTLLEAKPAPVSIAGIPVVVSDRVPKGSVALVQKRADGSIDAVVARPRNFDDVQPAYRTSGPSRVDPGQRVLQSLGFWARIGVAEPDRYQVGIVAKVNPAGGYFDKVVRPLVEEGQIERQGGRLRLLPPGARQVTDVGIHTLDDYHAVVLSQLDPPQARVLRAVIAGGPDGEHSREALGAASQVNAGGGYFDKCVAPLSSLGLISRRSGVLRPTEILFPRGLR